MKKIIDNVVDFPNDAETVRFTACFVSMIMRAEGIVDEEQNFYCNDQNGLCIRCGKCKNLVPINKLHNELYNLYTIVSGYGFLQIDLSNDEHMKTNWEFTSQVLLREFDYYAGFTMEFAGYEFEEVQAPESKDSIFGRIVKSIDKDIPVLVQLVHKYQWVLITGYDSDTQTVLGLDGSKGYWGNSPAEPAGYENGLFILPDWYEKLAHAFILSRKTTPTKDIRDVLRRGKKIMQSMQNKKYYGNSLEYIRNSANFEKLSDEQLLSIRTRVADWIGQPIDMRAMIGYAMNPLKNSGLFTAEEAVAMHKIHGLCMAVHDVLWIAWKAVGEYKKGDRLDWAKGLQRDAVRNVIGDCIDFVCKYDKHILKVLEEAF